MDGTAAAESAHDGMGTRMHHKAFGRHAKEALKAVEAEAERLESMLSRFLPASEIAKVNRSAGIRREPLSLECYKVLSQAAGFCQMSRGLFDVTIGPLVDLWDYKNAHEVPDAARIKQVLSLVNHTDLVLDPRKKTAALVKAGQSVDLGGIGKGYAGDRFLEIFSGYGVTSAFSNIGGNVSALGSKPDGAPWRVGVRHPRQAGCLLGALCVHDKAVVTSGDYERFFVDGEGKRRHHILDPVTGYPAESALISVTVVTPSAMAADALSTMLFVAGMEKGLTLLKTIPQAEAVLVDADLRVLVTHDLIDGFEAAPGIHAQILD